jgi:threonine dehydrogenase-like Zn-dependent dehydrogenase
MEMDRRKFMQDVAGATTALAVAPLFLPASARGANDRPAYGLIGCGGRGRGVSQSFMKLGAQCVAVCDVYSENIEKAQKGAPDAKPYVDYHELLTQKGLDFVLIATPDHQHCPNLLAALNAGKDVYLEKPMSHSLDESQKMVSAVRRTKQIVQVGMQRRSFPSIAKAQKLIEDGALGKISLVKAMWNWDFRSMFGDVMRKDPLTGKLDWQRSTPARTSISKSPCRTRSKRARRWCVRCAGPNRLCRSGCSGAVFPPSPRHRS